MNVRFNSFYIKGKQGKQLQFKLPELVIIPNKKLLQEVLLSSVPSLSS